MIVTIISFLIIFTLVVVSHEFGHFIVGRLNGIKVNEFTIGMGPAIYKKKGKNSVFAIRLFPIGGACIFEGMIPEEMDEQNQEENDELSLLQTALKNEERENEKLYNENNKTENNDIENNETENSKVSIEKENTQIKEAEIDDDWGDSGAATSQNGILLKEDSLFKEGDFGNAPVWGRIATVVAGPFFNIILAFLLSLILCWFTGTDLPVINDVMEGYPAAEAGLKSGDKIIRINNERIYLWREISMISMFNVGKPIDIVYERDNQRYNTTLTPLYSAEEDRYYIGFVGGTEYMPCKNLSVIKYSALEVRYWLLATYRSLHYMITGHGSKDDLAGPVGIATVIDDTIEETKPYGIGVVLLSMINMTVLLSVNLGVVNMIPFPALDGGRFIILLVEAITHKRVPPEKEGIFHFIGFILLMILMVFVLFNDISRIFTK